MLAEDTPEQQDRDRETMERWYRAQGIEPRVGDEDPWEKLVAMLCSRGG
jgi:hypothetical protein